MKLFLDDVRTGPIYNPELLQDDADWVIVRSVANAKRLIEAGVVTDMSLDHDMGERVQSGYDLVKWMVDTGNWPSGEITVHSANPVGAENMRALLDNAQKHGLRDPDVAKERREA